MLDPALLRDNLEGLRAALQKRGVDLTSELEELATLESRRRRILPELEGLKREQNAAGDEVARAKRQGQRYQQDSGRQSPESPARSSSSKSKLRHRRANGGISGLLTIPNLPHESVPVGKSSADNLEVRRRGTSADVSVHTASPLGFGAGARHHRFRARHQNRRRPVLGTGGAGAKLARALINFMLHLHTTEPGYTEVEPPFMVNRASLDWNRQPAEIRGDLFNIAGDWDLYMVPTAEYRYEHASRRDPRRPPAADPVHGLHAVLPQ